LKTPREKAVPQVRPTTVHLSELSSRNVLIGDPEFQAIRTGFPLKTAAGMTKLGTDFA
jgi:hypothetical protein